VLANIETTGDIFRYLASTLPPQTVLYIQLVIISTVIGLGSELLRTTALVQAFFRRRIGPRVTEQDNDTPFIGLRPLSNPRNFLYAQVLASVTLFLMLLFTFVVLSPSISYVLLFAFVALEIGCRHQFIYIYPATPDSGGRMWITFVNIALICMPFAQLVLLSYMALAKARKAFAMTIPLIVVTVLFNLYIRQKHFHIARYLSSVTCVELDHKNRSQEDIGSFDFLKDKYFQPALLPEERSAELIGQEMASRFDGVSESFQDNTRS
jgi:Calcium-dependent channel, 7TM region, putative phosphate